MNGNGIQPTVELATTNGTYPYPVYPMMNGYGNSGFGNGDWIWVILLLALFGGNWGNNGGFFGNNAFDNGYAWLSNGQKEIMQNTNNGFDTLHLSNNIEGVRDGIHGLSNQLCNSTASVVSAVNNGFSNAEISANARQIADMNQNFTNQLNLQNNLNQLNSRFSDCCCENRLGLANLNSTIISENCADRQALNEGVRDILANQTSSVQRILDQLCQDKIDQKNDTIAQLRQELLYARGQASQTEQTAQIRAGQENSANTLFNLLNSCPIPSTPVYGRTPIFTCNNGCGCSNGIYGTNI